MKNKKLEEIFLHDFGPLIQFAHQHRGVIKSIMNGVNREAGTTIGRWSFERWLNIKRSKRTTQPDYGLGRLILAVGNRVMAEKKAEILRKASVKYPYLTTTYKENAK